MNPLATLTACGLLSPLLVTAQPRAIALADLMARLQSMRRATDFRASGRLVKVAEPGRRAAYRISLRARSFAGVLKLFCEVKEPAQARVRLLVETQPAGKASIRAGHAGDRAPRELDFESWGEPFLDSDLSYEDLMENHFLWRRQSLLQAAKYGARNCYVVRSEPAASDRSHYSAVTSWLDQETYYPVKVEKVLKTSGRVKEFIYYGLRQSKGIWSASQIEVRFQGQPGSTLLIVTRGSEKASLSGSEFDPALLTKPD